MTDAKAVPVLYLDLVGTVIQGPDDDLGGFVNRPEDVRVFPAALTMMTRWVAEGGRLVAVSNQGGLALGHLSWGDWAKVVKRIDIDTGRLFSVIQFCPHHPSARTPELARCWCRKPAPGMIINGARELERKRPGEHYPPHLARMVGDRPEDEECARILGGMDFQWAADWRTQAGVAVEWRLGD